MTGAAVDFANLRVLVVENHALMRRLLREMLRGFGVLEVREAHSVAKALELIYREDFDAVILDFFLGDLDGADFARLVRHDPACRNRTVPVLLITAKPDHQKVAKVLEAGIDGMMAKPIAPRELYLRLHAMLAQPRTFVIGSDYVGPARRRGKSVPASAPSPRLMRETLRRARGSRTDIPKGRGATGIDEALFA